MSAHASLVLAREDANRLAKLFERTGNFPDAAESLELVLEASVHPSVAIVTTTSRVQQMIEWLKQNYDWFTPVQFVPISEALEHALVSPFYEENVHMT